MVIESPLPWIDGPAHQTGPPSALRHSCHRLRPRVRPHEADKVWPRDAGGVSCRLSRQKSLSSTSYGAAASSSRSPRLTTSTRHLTEDVVWRKLTAAGCRANVLLMDGRQCAASLSDEGGSPAPRGPGEVHLIPVRSRGAFHPKLLMLIGRGRGLLFVGSHNLTVAGFSRNRELTSRFEASAEDEAPLAVMGEAWRFMRAWVADQPSGLLAAFDAAERVRRVATRCPGRSRA